MITLNIKASQSALIAVKAAKMRPMVGRYSSRLYALNRGVSAQMLRVANQAEAVNRLAVNRGRVA